MIEFNLIVLIILTIIFGILYFIVDFFEHEHHQLHISLIAGISVAYFFVLVLPEISERLPEYPLRLQMLEYVYILIGFLFVHISEKLILQKVETKSQKRMRKLLNMEKKLEIVEKNIESLINKELKKEILDVSALKHLSQTLTNLSVQEEDIKAEIEQYKLKIQRHVNRDLSNLRFFTNYAYHFLIGIILVGLLIIELELLPGILFFIFAWFRTIISNRTEKHIVFTDLDIYEDDTFNKDYFKKFLLASSALTGIVVGLFFEFSLPIKLELELIYILFSFISGVILYTIVREVIPEKEKGKPLFFLFGAIGFIFIVLIIKIFTTLI